MCSTEIENQWYMIRGMDRSGRGEQDKTPREVLLDLMHAYPKYELNAENGVEEAVKEITAKLKEGM